MGMSPVDFKLWRLESDGVAEHLRRDRRSVWRGTHQTARAGKRSQCSVGLAAQDGKPDKGRGSGLHKRMIRPW